MREGAVVDKRCNTAQELSWSRKQLVVSEPSKIVRVAWIGLIIFGTKR